VEKLAYAIIGASMAVAVMTLFPMSRAPNAPMSPDIGKAAIDMAKAPGAVPVHRHPPRDVSAELPQPSVTHLVFPDVMGGYNVQILPVHFKFTPAAINHAPKENEGHAHIYVNGVKIARVYSNWYHLSGTSLVPGENEVRVTLNANDHSAWSVNGVPISSTVKVFIPEATP
tara:strand:+ start:1315 stop:1827 length:513 start_codon:yes stop_codon:yes gene_type:complete